MAGAILLACLTPYQKAACLNYGGVNIHFFKLSYFAVTLKKQKKVIVFHVYFHGLKLGLSGFLILNLNCMQNDTKG